MIDPKVRAAGLHLATAGAASAATVMWLSSHSVDVYAVMDQVNVVIKEVGKLAAMAAALAAGAVQVWKSTDWSMAVDVKERAKFEDSPLKGVITKDTPEGHDMAHNIPGPVVAAGTEAAAKVAEVKI